MSAMPIIKTEGFAYPNMSPRTSVRQDFRRLFSDGSMTIPTSDLAASLPNPPSFMSNFSFDHGQSFFQPFNYSMDPMGPPQHQQQPFAAPAPAPEEREPRSTSRGSIGKAKAPRSRSGRKGSMTDIKPTIARVRTASARAMSYSHPDGRPIGLDTHMENERTNSVSASDYTYGLASNSWSGSGSLPSMQSFGTTIDEAGLDSPLSPVMQLPPLPPDASEETRKQRRRECHNLVEKRRREHINTKIDELACLLPAQYEQGEELMEEEPEEEELGSPKGKKKNRRGSMAKSKDAAHCKGRILSHSVQYIHDLRQVNELQASRIQQLEAILSGATFPTLPPLSHNPSSYFETHGQGLEALRPSPDPEPFANEWNFNPVFEASPEGNSSGSASVMEMPTYARHGSGQMGMAEW